MNQGEKTLDDPNGSYEKKAEIHKALGHPVRLEIALALAEKPWCVCDLAQELGLRQPYLSQQLAYLRRAGIIHGEKEGLHVKCNLELRGIEILLEILNKMDLNQ